MFADTAGKLPHTEPRTGQNRRRRSKRSKEDNEQGSSAESCGSGDTRLNDSSSDESGAPRETSQRDQIWDSEDDEVNNEQNQNAAEDATRECDDEIYILLPPAQKTFIERQLSLLKGGKRNGPKPAELRIKPPNPLSRHFLREVTPDDFCVTALNVWDPETTFGLPKPACPHCMCKDKVKRRKWSRDRALFFAVITLSGLWAAGTRAAPARKHSATTCQRCCGSCPFMRSAASQPS